jgi:hypothetical protein
MVVNVIEWRSVPWPLWVFAAAILFATARFEIRVHGPIVVMVLDLAFMLAWLLFLLRGVRWVWLVTIALFVLVLAFELVSGSLQGWRTLLSMIELMLLLLPITRRYYSDHPTSAVA